MVDGFSDEKFYETETPIDFCEQKAKIKGLNSLSPLQKTFYYFGKEIDTQR